MALAFYFFTIGDKFTDFFKNFRKVVPFLNIVLYNTNRGNLLYYNKEVI